MTICVTIRHAGGQPGRDARLALTVVTVGNSDADEQKHVLLAGQERTVIVGAGQFVMVDESDNKEGG